MERRFLSRAVSVVLTLGIGWTAAGQYPSELVGFNGPPIDDPATSQEMFRQPEFSGSTSGYIVPNSGANAYDFNAAFRASGLQTEGAAALEVFFNWVDPADPDAWVRLTTYNGPERPNPTLDTRGKVRFKITNRSEFFAGEVGICLGIRETGVAGVPQLGDGGTTGPIEWVGVDTTINGITAGADGIVDTTAAGDDVQEYPVGFDINAAGLPSGTAVISPGANGVIDTTPAGDDENRFGYFIAADGSRRPIPAITLPPSASAYSIEWDLATGQVTVNGTPYAAGIAGMTGNGVLDAPNDRGTLEHIAITNLAGDTAMLIDVAIDELQFEATVPDPTPPPVIEAPVVATDTQVRVDCIPEATEAELFINDVSAGTQVPVSGVATFSGLSLNVGDVLTATQTANGITSDRSAPVVVYAPGTALAENFDGYATQADLESIWTQTDPANDRKLLLTTGSASSCQNFIVSDYDPGPPVSRLYFNLGSVNGSDADPLWVSYRFKHDSNNTNARMRFELTSSLNPTDGAVGFAFSNGIGGAFGEQYTTLTHSSAGPINGYVTDYFGYDYALTGINRQPGVWHLMQIEVKSSVVNFYIDGQLANPIDPNTSQPLYPGGVPRVNTSPFNYIVIGVGYSNNGPAMMYDDISVTFGNTPLPFGDPNPVPSPIVDGPLFPGQTTVSLSAVDPNASDVAVYADGTQVGSATGPFPGGVAVVSVPGMTDGQSITGTQTVAGTESCFSAPVVVSVPAPTLAPVLVPGQTSVQVSDIEENLAGAVSVYRDIGQGDLVLLGTLTNPTSDPAAVPVSPLPDGATIVATQTIGGVEGPASAGVVVAVPAPTVTGPIPAGATSVEVTDVHPLAELVTLYVDNNTYTTDPQGNTTVTVSVPALSQGSVVRATQTISGIEGPFSNAVLVGSLVVINEFNYDDSLTDNYAFVELYNAGTDPVDLTGWVIQVGDYVAGRNPPGVYYQVFIPDGTVIQPGGYWTVGMTDVASLPGAQVDLIDDLLDLQNGQNYLALRNPSGILIDAVGWETNKGHTFIPAEIYDQIGIGIWGNHVNWDNTNVQTYSGPPTAQARFLDGLDTNNNGRDWGILPATPGYSNNQPDLLPYFENGDSHNPLDAAPDWAFSYKPVVVIDPTVVDSGGVGGAAINPNAIPPSPDGGLCLIAWDEEGGGNADYFMSLAREDVTLEAYVYIDPTLPPSGFEEWKIGLRGSADGVHNFDEFNGATGVCWTLRRSSSGQTLYLMDENDGDDANQPIFPYATVLGQIDIGTDPSKTGWQRLLIETRGDQVVGIFGGTYGSRTDGIQFTGTHNSPGPGNVYISYREAFGDNSLTRPPTLDALSITVAVSCPGDLNGDGVVDLSDLSTLLTNFGTPSGATPEMGDIDGDGDVDLSDLSTLLSNFGSSCP